MHLGLQATSTAPLPLFAVGTQFQMPEQTQGKHEGFKTLIGQLCVVLAHVLSKGKVTPEAIADKWEKVGHSVMLEMNIPMHSTLRWDSALFA
jgi:hypothetical protein